MRHKRRASWLTGRPAVVMLTAVIATADLLTGPHTHFPGMYALPVALAGWYVGLGWALAIAAIAACAGYVLQAEHAPPLERGIDTASRLVAMAVLAFFVHRARVQGLALQAHVQNLEGILPICSHCHKIRDPGGQWHRLERYIAARSQAEFSHGICPDCVAKHYDEE